MKFLVCVIAAFAVLQNVSGDTSLEDSQEAINRMYLQKIRESMRERSSIDKVRSQIDQVCPGYGDKLENVTMEVAACAAEFDETEETMCSMVKNHAKRCLNPLISMFEECLPTEAKKIPSLVVDMLIATSNYLCKTDGEHILELANSCIKDVNPKTERCIRRIATQFQQYQRKERVPSVADLCDFAETLRPCLQSHLNTACKHPITKEVYLDLFDQQMKVCKKYKKNDIEVIDLKA